MTEKALHILEKMRRRKKPTNFSMDRILEKFNWDNSDNVGPVTGGNKEDKFLKELNSFEDEHEQFIESLRASRLGVDE